MDDPYATPRSFASSDRVTARCRREGKYVFIPVGSDLPCRCIVCNAEVSDPVKTRRVYWYSPWLYLLVLLNLLLFAIVALVIRKSAQVTPALCPEHKSSRRSRILMFLGAFLLLMLAGSVAAYEGYTPIVIPAFTVGMLLLIPMSMVSNTVRARRIDKLGITLSGCKEAFLISLSD